MRGISGNSGEGSASDTNDTLSDTVSSGTGGLSTSIRVFVDDESAANDGDVGLSTEDRHVVLRERGSVPHDTVDDIGGVGVTHISSVVMDSGVGETVGTSASGVEVTEGGQTLSAIREISKSVDVNSVSSGDADGSVGADSRSGRSLSPVPGSVEGKSTSITSARQGANSEEGAVSEVGGGESSVASSVLNSNDSSSKTGLGRRSNSAVVRSLVQDDTTTDNREITAQGKAREVANLINNSTDGGPVSKISSSVASASSVDASVILSFRIPVAAEGSTIDSRKITKLLRRAKREGEKKKIRTRKKRVEERMGAISRPYGGYSPK